MFYTGTGFVKAGFAGQNFPEVIFPSLVGRPLLRADEDQMMHGIEIKDVKFSFLFLFLFLRFSPGV